MARCHGSRLLTLRLLFGHSSAVIFSIIAIPWKVFTGLAWTRCPSRFGRSFCRSLSASFIWSAWGFFPNRQPRLFFPEPSRPTVLLHSSNHLPLGNCDSLRPETSPELLDSIRSRFFLLLIAQSLFRVYQQGANLARGTGESCLYHRNSRSGFRGAQPTSLTAPLPSYLGLSLRHPTSIC